MKFLKFTFALLLGATILSCSSNNEMDNENLTGQKGSVVLKFDNGVGNQDFIFGTEYSKSNGEKFKLSTLKYIISNISLKDSNGNVYLYPTDENVFIIDEADGNNAGEIFVTLEGVDAADYVSVSFGIGIDQDRFAKGANGQGDFLALAQSKEMLWSWATGYKFVRFDGTYSTTTITDEALNIHMGSVGTSLDNYEEVILTLPNTVIVREGKEPEVHVKADILKVFDGITQVNFIDGYDQVHTDQIETPIIAENMSGIFMVHHVHNK